MWQRIQTIFLLISVVVAITFLFMQMAVVNETEIVYGKDGIFSAGAIAIALISLFTITLYKNRKLQMRLCVVNMLFTVALVAVTWFAINDMDPVHIYFEYLAGLPAVIFIALLFAYRNIKKDEDLVKSMDRMR